MNKTKLLQTELERKLLKKFPGIFNIIDEYCCDQSEDHIIISGKITSVLTDVYNVNTLEAQKYVPAIHAICEWRKNKQIYEFDKDIASLLIESFEDDKKGIPMVTFSQCMPFNGVCISVDKSDFSVFATLDYNFSKNMKPTKSISLYFPYSGYSKSFPIQNTSVEEAIMDENKATLNALNDQKYIDAIKVYYPGMSVASIKETVSMQFLKDWEDNKNSIYAAIALLTYICAKNTEITDVKGNVIIPNTKPNIAHIKQNTVKQRTVKVGYRIGKMIRYNIEQENAETNNKTATHNATVNRHSKKSSHIRRGHYHHFWTGSKKDGEQTLILKWVAPTFINANKGEIIPTKHKIK